MKCLEYFIADRLNGVQHSGQGRGMFLTDLKHTVIVLGMMCVRLRLLELTDENICGAGREMVRIAKKASQCEAKGLLFL